MIDYLGQGLIRIMVIIFMGKDAKAKARSISDVVPNVFYLPFNRPTTPFHYPVAREDVRLIDTSSSAYSFIKYVVLSLFSQGAHRVTYIRGSQILIYDKRI